MPEFSGFIVCYGIFIFFSPSFGTYCTLRLAGVQSMVYPISPTKSARTVTSSPAAHVKILYVVQDMDGLMDLLYLTVELLTSNTSKSNLDLSRHLGKCTALYSPVSSPQGMASASQTCIGIFHHAPVSCQADCLSAGGQY